MRHERRRYSVLAVAALALAIGAPASAQIFKCTDAQGNVTYQQEACTRGQTAGKVEIFDNGATRDLPEKEANWQQRANRGDVAVGMPRRYVRQALGAPTTISGASEEGANEVWSYRTATRITRIGLRDGNVVWTRNDAPEAAVPAATTGIPPVPLVAGTNPDAAPAAVAQAADSGQASAPVPAAPVAAAFQPAPVVLPPPPPVAEATRARDNVSFADRRRAVVRGQPCTQVLADLGPPDKTTDLSAPADGTSAGNAVDAKVYVYEPAGADAQTRTRIACIGGQVAAVERTVAR